MHHEVIETIDLKYPQLKDDDILWPAFIDRPRPGSQKPEQRIDDSDLKHYWDSVRSRYCKNIFGEDGIPNPVDSLPNKWIVITISLTEDKAALLLARQRPQEESMLFCVPFGRHGKKDENEKQTFSFSHAMEEFSNILHEGDVSAKTAKDVPDEREAKKAWWMRRVELDNRLQEFLENIEFCWLGVFKVSSLFVQ